METKKNVLKQLLFYAGSYKWFTYLSWILSAISALMMLMPYIYIWLIIRDVLDSDTSKIAHYGWAAVFWSLGGMLIYLAALMCSHKGAFRVAANIRKKLLNHIVTLPIGFLEQFGSGKLRKIVNDSSGATETYLAHRLPDAAGSYATPLGLLVLLFWFDWRMGLLCIATTILGFIVMFSFMVGPKLKEAMSQYQNALDKMSNEAVEYVRGIPVVKTFGQTVFSFKRFKEAIDEYGRWVIGYTKSVRFPMVAYTTIINSIFAILMSYAIFTVSGKPSNEFMLNLLYYIIISPVLTLMLYRVMMQSEDKMIVEDAMSRIDKVLNVKSLDYTNQPQNLEDNSVEIVNATFRYQNATDDAIKNINLKINSGEHIALVGPSGGGKTTIASLISRFWDVINGEIKIGNINVKNIKKETLNGFVSFVFQDSKLLKTSILENVRLARPTATEEEVLAALHKAQCDDIIEKLPNGIHTVIGSKGTFLSGGEQQRIAIARVILQDAPILILDEATAFADPDNEERVQKVFSEMSKGKTMIMIAHRLSTVKNLDRIVVVKDGKIVQQGSHNQLVNIDGIYQNLWNEYCKTTKFKVK